MKLIKTLLVAGVLAGGLAACADFYDEPYGYDYDYGYYHHDYGRDTFWRDGHRYCRSLSDPADYYRCDPY